MAPPGDPCAILGDAQGFVVFVSIRAKGFKKRELALRAALYSKGRRRRVPDPGNYRTLARVPVDAPTAESVHEIWLFDPGEAKKYFVRLFLYDREEHLLNIADTDPVARLTPTEQESIEQTSQGCSELVSGARIGGAAAMAPGRRHEAVVRERPRLTATHRG